MALLPPHHHHTHHNSCYSLASLSLDQTLQQRRMSQQRPQLCPSQLSAKGPNGCQQRDSGTVVCSAGMLCLSMSAAKPDHNSQHQTLRHFVAAIALLIQSHATQCQETVTLAHAADPPSTGLAPRMHVSADKRSPPRGNRSWCHPEYDM